VLGVSDHAIGIAGANTDGFHIVELATSFDLQNWTRLGQRVPVRSVDNNAFFPTSRRWAGAYDYSGAMGPAAGITVGDAIYFYNTGGKYRATDMAPAWMKDCDDLSGHWRCSEGPSSRGRVCH
jgi:hypothetical protein